MNTLKLISITDVKTAKDNRKFYGAEFQDPMNPFAKTVSRNFWQQFNGAGEPVWRGADPVTVKQFIGKTIPGEIATREVVPYTITSTKEGQPDREVNTYTTVILGHELAGPVFKSLGHPLADAPVIAANADIMAANEAEVEIA